VIRHTFPELTPAEKNFVAAFVFCGLVAAIVGQHRPMGGPENVILGLCAYAMGPVLCYWMRHEPDAFLQLFLFPYTGWRIAWPRIVLLCVRGFGIVSFFGCLAAFPLVFLPASWVRSPLCELIILALSVIVSARALGKRPRSVEPRTHP
jgi:hypothetical protein